MTAVNYWFGMERGMALYQIIGGGKGLVSAETPTRFRKRDGVCELLLRDLESLWNVTKSS